MAEQRDYYTVLGVSRNAAADEIRKAYRSLARKLHPDVNKEPDAAKRFAEVQEAYDVLSDENKRKEFDRFGHVASAGRGDGTTRSSGPFSYSWSSRGEPGGPAGGFGIDEDDLSSIFEQMMGGSGMHAARPHRARAPRSASPQGGADLAHAITIPFMTAAKGGAEHIRLSRSDGEIENVEVKIPAGIESGSKLRLKGKGQPGVRGGQPGDLFLSITVLPHPYFRREGLNLHLDVPITIAEAALGTTVAVPLLEQTAELRIPPGTSSGKMLRIKGKGIASSDGRTGDFYAMIQIVAPAAEALTTEDREFLNRLGAGLKKPRTAVHWTDNG